VANAAIRIDEGRVLPRDEVHYRARATREDDDEVLLLLVNMSAGGLAARCGASFAIGERVVLTLPVVGRVPAECRWCLGGRAGFQFEPAVPLPDYLLMLAEVLQG